MPSADTVKDNSLSVVDAEASSFEASSVPDIRLASVQQNQSSSELQSQGLVTGEVAINFRSETFPLEQLVSSSDVARLGRMIPSDRP